MPASSAPDTNVPLVPTVDTTPLNGSSFTRTLQLGSEGDDVQRLQQFLAQDPTIYPEARITGYFGSLTRAAIGRWQIDHHIVPDESADGFGIVGPKTRTAINALINF
ncbi:peptidoglycan-binding protein [Candidatus Kaiserbacteria bacterium]|nr:peptidoglycan-binding protein [Candidatus Kaiserbacteria bacterium]